MSRSRWIALYLPSTILVCVALLQIQLGYFGARLTPSKGGGYGLFSTVDKQPNRQVRIYLTGRDGERAVSLPGKHRFEDAVYRARAYPTDERLGALAEVLAAEAGGGNVQGLRVEVWKLAFDASTLTVRRVPVAQAAAVVGDGGR